jgi:hypothetical protein
MSIVRGIRLPLQQKSKIAELVPDNMLCKIDTLDWYLNILEGPASCSVHLAPWDPMVRPGPGGLGTAAEVCQKAMAV